MSLQIWLPLNGTLDNYGLSQASLTLSETTIDNGGKIGKCYSFNGDTSYIDIVGEKLNSIFKGGTNPFSFCAWVYHADATRAILFGDYALTNAINFNIELNTSHGVRFYWNGSPDHHFTGTLSASTWEHISIIYNGTSLQYYLNGVLKENFAVVLSEKIKNATSNFRLGRDSRTGTTAFNGKLNDIRIYDHALSQKEIKDISKALIFHMPLTDASINAYDQGITNSYDGIITGTLTAESDTAKHSYSYKFTGSQYITITDYPKNQDTLTVSWWGYMDNWSSYARAISCTEGGGWNFEPSSSYMSVPVYQTGVGYIHVNDTVLLSNLSAGWHHWAFTFDSTNLKLYRDGTYIGSVAGANALSSNSQLYIGGRSGSRTFSGSLNDFRVYATALSADAVKELYAMGRS